VGVEYRVLKVNLFIMEKLPYQEYRDDLASKLREIRNSDKENPEVAKAKAQGYLIAIKETQSEKYDDAKNKHQTKVEKIDLYTENLQSLVGEKFEHEELTGTIKEALARTVNGKEELVFQIDTEEKENVYLKVIIAPWGDIVPIECDDISETTYSVGKFRLDAKVNGSDFMSRVGEALKF
jgi:phenylalanyl-tRNA synthetase beta subunit